MKRMGQGAPLTLKRGENTFPRGLGRAAAWQEAMIKQGAEIAGETGAEW